MKMTMGERQLELPGEHLDFLTDSSALLDDAPAMQERMANDGYLLLKGVLDRDLVMEARRQMLELLNEEGQLDPNYPLMDAVRNAEATGGFRGGDKKLTDVPAFVELVREGKMIQFWEKFLGGEVRPFDFRWLRVVPPGAFTGAHYDVVYMGRGTLNLYTTWTPLGDVSFDMGPLAILEGSHQFEKVKETYGKMDVDRDHVQGWFSDDPLDLIEKYGGTWKTAEFEAGDILVFGMFTMHASFKNSSNRFRLSSDTRYQLASEEADERWVGEKPIAHYAWHDPEKNVSMEEMRSKWGV